MSLKSSVVVPTYNGKQRIINFLDSMLRQSRFPDEIVVVVDGSKDDTVATINATQRFKRLPLIVHVQENKGRPAARNAGVAKASHDLILSFDDDMVLTQDVIRLHLEHHEKYPGSVCVGYQAEKKPTKDDSNYNFLDFRYFLSRHWSNNGAVYPTPMNVTNYYLTTANSSYPRFIFDVVGGFDEKLKEVEDFDFGTRIIQRGYPIYYNKDILAWHDNPDWDFTKYVERQVQYRKDDLVWLQKLECQEKLDKEFRKHPRYTVGKEYPPVKKAVLQHLARPFYVRFIESKYIKLVPRTLRFKFMDMVTAAFTYTLRNPR